MKTKVEKHFDRIAKDYDSYTKKRDLHYMTLKKLLRNIIPPGKKVFEVGCGTGDILAYLKPIEGYGIDISSEMIKIANIKYSKKTHIKFSTKWPYKRYDYIFMSDVIEHLERPLATFQKISKLMGPKTTFINTMMNPVWEPVEAFYNWMGWKMPEGPHYRIKYQELRKIVERAGLKIIKHDYKLLMPIKIPFITNFANRYLEKPLRKFAFIEYVVAMKK